MNQTEIVHRPEAGLARGKKEAPPPVFFVVLVFAALGLALYLGWLGWLYGRRKHHD